MRLFLILLCVAAVAGCGTSAENNENAGDDTNSGSVHANADPTTGVLAGPPFVLAGCYEMTMNQDTAQLSLEVKDTTVSGNLRYDWNEKDGNTGTIKGVLRDSLIIADYTFQSEGMTSVREVVFKIQDTTLLQGFGDLNNRQGKIVFRNLAGLQYTPAHPFVKVPCAEN